MENQETTSAQKSTEAKFTKLKKIRFKTLNPAEKLLAMLEANLRAAAVKQKSD